MRYGLAEETVLKISQVMVQFPAVEEVVIYGSRAKGNFKASSDIDIVLKGNDINLQLLSRITLKLDDLLLPYKFDLSIYNHIVNSELLDHIDRVGQTLWDINRMVIKDA
jgi:predicted nucleotidyltransferase